MSGVPRDRSIIQIAAVDDPSGGAGQPSLHGAMAATDVECGKWCDWIEAKAAEVLAEHSCAPFHPEVVFGRGVVPLLREIPCGGIVICFQDHYYKTLSRPAGQKSDVI